MFHAWSSEPVIQAMLKAALPAESEPDSAPDQDASNLIGNKFDSSAVITYNPPDEVVPRADIESKQLKESGSGNHHHQVITLSGIRLFILRDEGSYSSLTERAKAVANRLSNASAKDGEFHPGHVAGSDAVMFTATGSTKKTMIVTISAQDARAYHRRSGRHVSQDLLAAYWSDLLTDYWALSLGGQPPERLTKLHEGGALQELYEGLDKAVNTDADRLSRAFQALPKQERDHLLKLAVSVPSDFIATEEYEGETP